MNPELEAKIHSAAPLLWREETCIECRDGWFDLLMDLSTALEALGEDIEVVQVKEKYGTLRFYINGGTAKADELISAAEARSSVTCDICGAEGTLDTSRHWRSTRCEKHQGVI